jgi:putative oxidoreductase
MKTNKTIHFTLLLVRVLLGLVIAAHGSQKLLGWFGGYGFEGTMGFFTGVIGLPYIVSLLIILAESVGMIALIFGLFSRILSTSLVLIMLGAIVTTHAQYGFFMNWFGAQGGEGFEFHLLVIALASVVSLNGAGTYSIDAVIKSKLQKPGKVPAVLFA